MTNYPKLNPEFKAKWIEALKSGEYRQGDSMLFNVKKDRYCCIGVACSISGIKDALLHNKEFPDVDWGSKNPDLSLLMENIVFRGDLVSNALAEKLTDMNDYHGNSFTEIADWIEENL